MRKQQPIFNTAEVAASFNRAAAQYDRYAFFQRNIETRLMQRLELIKLIPKRILDLGAGTGHATIALKQAYPKAEIFSSDLAEHMLAQQRDLDRSVCGDVHALPLLSNSMDMIFSNLMLHWSVDLNLAFAEVQRVLKPGGLFLFSSLGPDTLDELRQSWRSVDDGHHVHDYVDMHDVGDCLLAQQLVDPVMDMEKVVVDYPDVLTLMRDIKKIGAHNLHRDRARGVTSKSALRKVMAAYEEFRNSAGRYPLTYEVVFGHAWGAEVASQQNINGEVQIPIDAIVRRT